ncbi:hypothetical protein IP91_02407 [Pseudoduganella lurida]|uniref:Uncharacterized protein n=1 Tax=Pseudoduganella lurida TaxID=1036180 RepID=A0A562RC24_9BURK|nr:hypothetical protein [Pseudoduganella lurida]TWI66588.1 hypothetical protein IP91_02407 [Pseudoduganella lurida]
MNHQRQDRNRAGALRRARAWAGALALVIGAVVAAPAGAGPSDGPQRRDDRRESRDSRDSRDDRAQEQSGRWGGSADPRSFEARAEEQRRVLQENANNAEMTRRMSRMTPDERADLRRQINDARQEVYSVPRR